MADDVPAQHIGLLFVHGIGEQKRFEHLTNSVTEFGELMLQSDQEASVSIINRTADWKLPPGQPDATGLAPITLTLQSQTRHIVYDCYEVWWADLGARSGIIDVVTFWLWALGQWNAPIYREIDASHLRKDERKGAKPVSGLAKLPESVAGKLVREPLSRFKLLLAGLAAMFVALTWTLAKRIAATLLGQAPTPTLIVQYVGDVRTYEERASPGATSISDPGYPRRVGIRRRMVAEMVALGMRPLDGWYVIAHSLGTVVAYNGLTEIGHALPNYLPNDQWARVEDRLRRDEHCRLREDLYAMMPARPDWLQKEDVINRSLLFAKLKGFLTYGSPLDKFAALWPRIVATATDRTDAASPFQHCWWINLAAPHDPVAGILKRFEAGKGTLPPNAIPKIQNKATPWDWAYMLAHIRYFIGAERCDQSRSVTQKRRVLRWLMGDTSIAIPSYPQGWPVRLLSIDLAYALIILFLWLMTAIVLTAAGGISLALFGAGKATQFKSLDLFFQSFFATLGPILGIALATILIFGLWRWFRESGLNADLARADKQADRDSSDEKQAYWDNIISMLSRQSGAGLLMLIVSGALVLAGLYADITGRDVRGYPTGWLAATVAAPSIIIAMVAQTLINKLIPSLK